jgi:hypothetical protein
MLEKKKANLIIEERSIKYRKSKAIESAVKSKGKMGGAMN